MKHTYFGDIDTSRSLWRISKFYLGGQSINIWLWECKREDLDWLEKKISNYDNLIQSCYQKYCVEYDDSILPIYDGWFHNNCVFIYSIFGKISGMNDVSVEKSWSALQLSKIELFREDFGVEMSVDFHLRNMNSDYVVNFKFDEQGSIFSCGWES